MTLSVDPSSIRGMGKTSASSSAPSPAVPPASAPAATGTGPGLKSRVAPKLRVMFIPALGVFPLWYEAGASP